MVVTWASVTRPENHSNCTAAADSRRVGFRVPSSLSPAPKSDAASGAAARRGMFRRLEGGGSFDSGDSEPDGWDSNPYLLIAGDDILLFSFLLVAAPRSFGFRRLVLLPLQIEFL